MRTAILALAMVWTTSAAAGQVPDATAYSELLQAHVQPGGWVDYAALAGQRRILDAYVQSLADAELDALDDADRLATLINAYNAFTLVLILDHWQDGKLASIMDIPDDRRWDHARWALGGKTLSLNQIEHEIIRKQFNEPRIHWALVCAAYSCPPLRPEAYVGDRLDAQLADQERLVLLTDDPRFVRREPGTLHVTRLFEWYGDDFGDWRDYVLARVKPRSSMLAFKFLDYDWRLNDVRYKPESEGSR